MAIISIPLSDSACFFQETTLDGQAYVLKFRWNTRGSFWSMDIYDTEETLILSGVRLVIAFPLLLRSTSSLVPPGEFYLLDSNVSTMKADPGRYDFIAGRKLELVYIEAGT